jgi:hypothetical protein
VLGSVLQQGAALDHTWPGPSNTKGSPPTPRMAKVRTFLWTLTSEQWALLLVQGTASPVAPSPANRKLAGGTDGPRPSYSQIQPISSSLPELKGSSPSLSSLHVSSARKARTHSSERTRHQDGSQGSPGLWAHPASPPPLPEPKSFRKHSAAPLPL